MKNNCHECNNSYSKDLFDDSMESVDICLIDNVHIGYPEDSLNEQCRFKTVLRTWSECSKVIRNAFTGSLCGTDFVQAFKYGNFTRL